MDKKHDDQHDLPHLLPGDPFSLFAKWYALSVNPADPDSSVMYLATSGIEGKPSLRTILLKGVEDGGFVFFTNYRSRKGTEIYNNPEVALLFHWPNTGRQVRIEGKAEKIPAEASDAYFNSRPLMSRISAIASPQSRVLTTRDELIEKWHKIENEAGSGMIKRPEHWGGYRVIPRSFEFWMAGNHRLHYRNLFTRQGDTWNQHILAP